MYCVLQYPKRQQFTIGSSESCYEGAQGITKDAIGSLNDFDAVFQDNDIITEKHRKYHRRA